MKTCQVTFFFGHFTSLIVGFRDTCSDSQTASNFVLSFLDFLETLCIRPLEGLPEASFPRRKWHCPLTLKHPQMILELRMFRLPR